MDLPCAANFAPRLWIYTNFDCNLACSYCCARSSPRAERRSLSLSDHRRLIDEAVDCGIQEVFLTGGEPFLLPDIADRVRASANRIPTTVLTNAMLFRGSRLAALESLAGLLVRFQVSLDGPEATAHDAIRGSGSWEKAVAGIRQLLCFGFEVSVSTTQTASNLGLEEATRDFVLGLGIASQAHFVRPLARRGFSEAGMEASAATLEPEVTVSRDGVFWHPLACEDDLLVSRRIFPFAGALEELHSLHHKVLESGGLPQRFR
ncbi:MAG: radical SAM protein [Tepidiformaceae bacterium]